jgi:hypothetical protein
VAIKDSLFKKSKKIDLLKYKSGITGWQDLYRFILKEKQIDSVYVYINEAQEF